MIESQVVTYGMCQVGREDVGLEDVNVDANSQRLAAADGADGRNRRSAAVEPLAPEGEIRGDYEMFAKFAVITKCLPIPARHHSFFREKD